MSDISFPDAVTTPTGLAIACASKPQAGVKVKIGPLNDAQVNAVLKLSWAGRNNDGAIPGTQTSLNHFITEADKTDGLERTIGDYFQHIKPIRKGWADVEYTINGGPSTSATIRVDLVNSDGQTCDEVPA